MEFAVEADEGLLGMVFFSFLLPFPSREREVRHSLQIGMKKVSAVNW